MAEAALKRHWNDVVEGVSDASVIGINAFLYTENIYDKRVREAIDAKPTSYDKMNEMLKALEKKIKRDSAAFNTFLEALRKDSAYDDLANTLASTRDEIAKVCSPKCSSDSAVKNGGIGNSSNGRRGSTSREERSISDDDSEEQAFETSDDGSDDTYHDEVVRSRKRSRGTCKNGKKRQRLDLFKSGKYKSRQKKTSSSGRDEIKRRFRTRPTEDDYTSGNDSEEQTSESSGDDNDGSYQDVEQSRKRLQGACKNGTKKRRLDSSKSKGYKSGAHATKTSSRGRAETKRKSRSRPIVLSASVDNLEDIPARIKKQRIESKRRMRKAGQKLLKEKNSELTAVIELNLGEITSIFWSKGLIPKGLYKDIVNGVVGKAPQQQAAQIMVAIENKLQIKPDCISQFFSVLKVCEEDFVKELEQQYKDLLDSVDDQSQSDISSSDSSSNSAHDDVEDSSSEELAMATMVVEEELPPKKHSKGDHNEPRRKHRKSSTKMLSGNGSKSSSGSSGSSSLLDSEPTQRDMRMLVAEKVTDSYGLGTMLDLSYAQIEMFNNEERKVVAINMKILTTWVKCETKKPIMWHTLLEALRDIKEKRLARMITEELEQRGKYN